MAAESTHARAAVPLRLAVVSDSPLGGQGAAAQWHAGYFAQRGWTVELLCRAEDGQRPTQLSDSVRWVRWDAPLAARSVVAMAASARRLRQLITDLDPDVVHVHGVRSFAVARAVRRHVHVTNHTFDVVRRPWSPRALAYRALPLLAAGAFAVAPGLGSRWTVVQHASPWLRSLRPRAGGAARAASQTGVTVLWLGRLTPQKRPEDVVRAVAEASRRAPVRGLFVGDGPLVERCRTLATAMGAPVDFEPPTTDVQEVLDRADVYCLLSNFEGLPFALQEAMWCGLPPVLTPLPALTAFAGDAGLYAADVPAAAHAFVTLADDAVRAAKATAARARALAVLTPDDPGPTYARAYATPNRTGGSTGDVGASRVRWRGTTS